MCRQELPVSVYVVIDVWPGSCGPGVVSAQCCIWLAKQWRGPPHVMQLVWSFARQTLVSSTDPHCLYVYFADGVQPSGLRGVGCALFVGAVSLSGIDLELQALLEVSAT